ncbi:hypothetical protein [Terrihabitans rhizophilus]|uniref:Uncharacterized protein n=1 Tax=Terrihabitans rhizophilus TaxID=3092662 RepID=A0ABU4RNA0_9HYPH|nr:hypothetical protein [Terrihabitans sp. PJ23]MDX6806081.1 hypothetical protein [Terrihabitans sp. PJ23]
MPGFLPSAVVRGNPFCLILSLSKDASEAALPQSFDKLRMRSVGMKGTEIDF